MQPPLFFFPCTLCVPPHLLPSFLLIPPSPASSPSLGGAAHVNETRRRGEGETGGGSDGGDYILL